MAGNGVTDEMGLELRPEDGEIFKIKAYHLKSGSAVFRDMPSVPSPSSPNASESAGNIIDIPADKATLRLFVTLLESGPLAPFTSPCTPVYIGTMVKRLSEFKHHPERCGLKRLNAITDILKRFDCSSALLERALFHLRPTFGEAPWRFFEVAANSSDIQNAKDAIRRFPAAPQFTTLEPEMMGAKTVRSIPLEYFLGYLRAVGAQKKAMNTHTIPHDTEERSTFWAGVAAGFAPMR